jgi:ribose transport system permease protein
MQVLRNMITLVTSHNNIEFAIIGAVILAGVTADEVVRRFALRRRAAREAVS